MRTIVLTLGILVLQVNRVFCQSTFGSVFPIPLATPNDDPNFQQCPTESGAYAHTTNCSLFHMCTFGILATYSCIEGFFFNPSSGKCQFLPFGKDTKCTEILKHMADTEFFPLAESVKGYDYYHRRKSATSVCTQNGIYPDMLDCSLFHYCHRNKKHDILQCPSGLHFDPKLFMCSAPQLVDCQYEPPAEIENTSTMKSNSICQDYASGTHLPVANQFDEFILCESDGTSTVHKCQLGFRYNALKAECEKKSCEANPSLCQNHGRCIDEPISANGFRCICSVEYQGEHCEKAVQIIQTVKSKIDTSIRNLLQFTNRLIDDRRPQTTAAKSSMEVDLSKKSSSNNNENSEGKIRLIENLPHANTPLSRMFHRLNNNLDDQQRATELIQIIFITMFTLIGLILLASMIFGMIVCIRMIFTSPVENVGTWKVLADESKV